MAIANITNNILTDSGVAISSLVSGSGTTNYISKFTASGVLGNSLIWDNGTNVGIGNTNTTYKLDVSGTGRYVGTLTLATTQYVGNLQFGTSQPASIGYDAGSGAMTYNITAGAAATSTYYNFLADGTSIVNILKGGNVGIGVTPNAWYTGNSSKALQIGVAGVGIWGYGSTTNINTYLTNNAYYDSVGWKYAQASGKASFYQQNNGIHFWATTDTVGTAAGDVLSFTERMRLSATGNLAIGTSSDTYRLEVNANAATWATRIYNASATGNGLVVVTNNTTTNGAFGIYNGTSYVFYARNDGNVGIGTSAPARKLVVRNDAADPFISVLGAYPNQGGILFGDSTYNDSACAIRQDRTNNALWFSTSGASSERMRITDNGNVLIGTTTTTINSSNFGIRLAPDGTFQNSRNVNGSAGVMNVYGNAGQMLVYGNGTLQNTTGTYGIISDLRLKENIIDTTPKLDKLMQVRIVNYNLIQYPEQNLLGVIAQELEQIFPSLVDEHIDKDEEGNDLETTTKSVKMSVFVPILIKAIQELKAEIDELKNK
jgi:hypothetical protein